MESQEKLFLNCNYLLICNRNHEKTSSRKRLYPVPVVRIFHFQDDGDVTNPVGLSLYMFPRKCKSGPMLISRAKNWRQKSANPALYPAGICPRGQPPGLAADTCIKNVLSGTMRR